jgi:hypothetical protein
MKPFKIHNDLFPTRIQETLEKWINEGGDLSGFWHAMLSGDYEAAALNADAVNECHFVGIVLFLVSSAPSGCFGSPARVKEWRSKFEVSQ